MSHLHNGPHVHLATECTYEHDAFGDPRLPPRFWAKVERHESGCWLWTAALKENGYGKTTTLAGNRTAYAHRLAAEAFLPTFDPVLTVDHLCKVRRCVNPAHMEMVTQGENTRRGDSIGNLLHRSGQCKRGHSFAEHASNPRKNGTITCRLCARMRNSKRKRAA